MLSACQAPGSGTLSGASMVLHQPLTVRANSVKVLFQDGQVIYSPNEYRTFCRLAISDLQAVPRTLNPDQFTVSKTWFNTDNFAALSLPAYWYASITWDEGLASPVLYQLNFDLVSAAQPNVIGLRCSRRQDPTIESRYPTLGEVQQALGGIISIIP